MEVFVPLRELGHTTTSDLRIDLGGLAKRVGIASSFEVTAKFLIGSWLSLLADSPLPIDDKKRPLRTYSRFIGQLESMGLLETIDKFSNLAESLMDQVQRDQQGALTSPFDRKMLSTPIAKEYISWTKDRNPQVFSYMLTFLRLGKKVAFDDNTLQARAFRSWLSVEERLSDLVLEGNEHIPHLRLILLTLLPDFEPPPCFMGGYGPGTTAEKYHGAIEKSFYFSMYPKLRRLLSPFSTLSGLTADAKRSLRLLGVEHVSHRNSLSTHAASLLAFVPKNKDTLRSICMEPSEFMYMQQHVRYMLERCMASSWMGRFVTINDQTRNQQGALYGSRSGNVDTIDLSMASDSVALELVKAIFPRPMLYGLLATRTCFVKRPDGLTVRVNKFAPMGSAVCFPVQCILFTAVVLLAYIYRFEPSFFDDPDFAELSRARTLPSYFSNNAAPYRLLVSKLDRFLRRVERNFSIAADIESLAVYGDDIICDSRATSDVVEILSSLGFSVNLGKSFGGTSPFRESCGIFALDGHDVTPLSFKVPDLNDSWGPSEFAALVGLVNEAGDLRHLSLRKFLINVTLKTSPPLGLAFNPIPFSSVRDLGFAIYSKSPRNTHLAERYNEDLQRNEVRAWRIRSSSSLSPDELWKSNEKAAYAFDYASYLMFSRATVLRGEGSVHDAIPRIVQVGTKLSWGWLSTEW